MSDQKPKVKVSTSKSSSSMSYVEGTLWNFITQEDASKVSQNMYDGNEYVESDLVNSYAWDTAIVFIEKMKDSNYANQKDGNKTLQNTGKTEDEKCNIFDMAGNLWEWTTEYSTGTYRGYHYPCAVRGGYYDDSSYYTASRNDYPTSLSDINFGFRPLLYLK